MFLFWNLIQQVGVLVFFICLDVKLKFEIAGRLVLYSAYIFTGPPMW